MIFDNFFSQLSIELSDNHNYALEISATRSCSVRCEYCPQDQLIRAGSIVGSSRLDYEVFTKCINNLNGVIKNIHWTGYAEPCLLNNFPEMVLYAQRKGFNQMVSTTLVGQQHCIDFLATTDAVATIVLHLPDAKGLMEHGALKVDGNYVDRLQAFLEGRLQHRDRCGCSVTAVTFGEDFNPLIAPILADPRYESVLLSSTVSSQIHSRAGAIRHFSGLSIGMISRSFSSGRKNAKSFKDSLLKSIPLPFFKCSYMKFRQPVLLPDGQLNLCCMDYGLRGILGNLSIHSLKTIYSDWNKRNINVFAKGKLSPCIECEYYRNISLYDFLRKVLGSKGLRSH
jgi:hypothetical protein